MTRPLHTSQIRVGDRIEWNYRLRAIYRGTVLQILREIGVVVVVMLARRKNRRWRPICSAKSRWCWDAMTLRQVWRAGRKIGTN